MLKMSILLYSYHIGLLICSKKCSKGMKTTFASFCSKGMKTNFASKKVKKFEVILLPKYLHDLV